MSGLLFVLILTGICLLALSLKPISSILSTVGKGRLRRHWRGLRYLIFLFMFGYAAFWLLLIGRPKGIPELVVSTILMAGGIFVFVVAHLSAATTMDIVRIARLEQDVIRDPLTGVYNRRFLDIKLAEEISRARQLKLPLSAMLIDLDHFKVINDNYGHPIGDQVLKHVARLITRHARVTDMVVRYGGEEFVIISPDSDLDTTCHFGQNMISLIANSKVNVPGAGPIIVTASIGVASLATGSIKDDLLARADKALYNAKRDGRNCLRFLTHLSDA